MKDVGRFQGRYSKNLITIRRTVTHIKIHNFKIKLQKAGIEQLNIIHSKLRDETDYKELANTLPVIVFELDKEGKITFTNQSGLNSFGYTWEDFLRGVNALETFIPEDRIRARENIIRVLKGEEIGLIEYNALRKNGTTFPVVLRSTPICQSGKLTGLRGIMIDISQRKRMEEKLRKHSHHLEKVVKSQSEILEDTNELLRRKITEYEQTAKTLKRITDNMMDLICQVDTEGTYLYVSSSYQLVLGYNSEDLLGRSFIDYIHPDDKEKIICNFQRALKNATWGEAEFRYKSASGHYRWIEAVGKIIYNSKNLVTGAVVCSRDITRRKLAEEALQESEDKFSRAFRASPDLIRITRLSDGKYVEVNDAFLEITGYSREEIIGTYLDQNELWADPKEREMITHLLISEGRIRNQEIKFKIKSGKILMGLVSAEFIDIGGEKHVLAVTRDITEIKQLEKEITRLGRLNLIGEMAAGIGHEVRNPMTTVRGLLQLLSRKMQCDEYKDYFYLMIEELDRANSIITEFLSLANDKRVEKKAANLNVLLETFMPLIESDARESDKNVIFYPSPTPSLFLDEKEIRQLILNLVRNGLEAMQSGGNLTISTYIENEEVIMAIKDEGKGIRAEALEKIGTPFFTTKDKGTGLGLAVCYSIANRHNATITYETSASGTTFLVRFKTIDA